MVKGRKCLRFPPQALQFFFIARKFGRQNFDGDVTVQFRIACAVNLAHSSRANGRKNLIRADTIVREHAVLDYINPSPQRHKKHKVSLLFASNIMNSNDTVILRLFLRLVLRQWAVADRLQCSPAGFEIVQPFAK